MTKRSAVHVVSATTLLFLVASCQQQGLVIGHKFPVLTNDDAKAVHGITNGRQMTQVTTSTRRRLGMMGMSGKGKGSYSGRNGRNRDGDRGIYYYGGGNIFYRSSMGGMSRSRRWFRPRSNVHNYPPCNPYTMPVTTPPAPAPATAVPTTTAPATVAPTPTTPSPTTLPPGDNTTSTIPPNTILPSGTNTTTTTPLPIASTNTTTIQQEKCTDNPQSYTVNVDVQIQYLNDEFAACDSAEQDASINTNIQDALNENFATVVTDWQGTATFGPFVFDLAQEVNNVDDPFAGLRRRLLRNGTEVSQRQRQQQIQESCPTPRPVDSCLPAVADYCRWGCITAATTNCGNPLSTTGGWPTSLAEIIRARLAGLGYDCLGISDQLKVVVTVV